LSINCLEPSIEIGELIEQAAEEVTSQIRQLCGGYGGWRPLALGRKNYLFAGSDAGGHRAATLYTLIETARLNGVDRARR